MSGRGLNWSGSEYSRVACCCEHGNELAGCTKCRQFPAFGGRVFVEIRFAVWPKETIYSDRRESVCSVLRCKQKVVLWSGVQSGWAHFPNVMSTGGWPPPPQTHKHNGNQYRVRILQKQLDNSLFRVLLRLHGTRLEKTYLFFKVMNWHCMALCSTV